jgi:thiol-disulfide isomerase/thioredoxin
MGERLLISLVILAGLGLLWLGWRYYKHRLAQSIRPLETEAGLPTLLYFSGQYCAACQFQQTLIVEQLAAQWGAKIVIKKYDVAAYPELAQHYKVLSLPATVVLNRQGQVTHLNYGVTSLTKLEEQLS